jgi:predicted Rossmann-fold nucleotide-binding protein
MRAGCRGETVPFPFSFAGFEVVMANQWPHHRWQAPNQDTDAFEAERDLRVTEIQSILGSASPAVAVSGWGKNQLSALYMEGAAALGDCLAHNKFPLLTGGLGGAMHAVTTSYLQRNGPVALGILPKDFYARAQVIYGEHFHQIKFVPTQLDAKDSLGNHTHYGPNSRNHVLIFSGDLIVCLPGEAGSIAEATMAKEWYGKTVITFDPEAGGNKTADLDPWRERINQLGIRLLSSAEICNWLAEYKSNFRK